MILVLNSIEENAMTKFYVYGDYGYASECELHSQPSAEYAKQWAEGYTRWGDMGGYDVIEVAYFNADGEYVVIWRMDAEDPEFEREMLYEDDGA
jgi:hypothetical protein